jgi:hypothetical protein
MIARTIVKELRIHAPFTAFGAVTGIVVMAMVIQLKVPQGVSARLFWTLHPLHVLLSAWVTAGMHRRYWKGGVLRTVIVGYLGSVAIATLSDCVIPYVGELLLDMPHRGIHLGLIEKWWLVNPLAVGGIALGLLLPRTKFPHAGHVLLSTWASLFHMTMALGARFDAAMLVLTGVFLFLAVWIPCCTSDIVFPLLFEDKDGDERAL